MDDEDEIQRWWWHKGAYDQDPIAPILVEHQFEFAAPYLDAGGREWFGPD